MDKATTIRLSIQDKEAIRKIRLRYNLTHDSLAIKLALHLLAKGEADISPARQAMPRSDITTLFDDLGLG